MEKEEDKELFWADQLADKIIKRKKFFYIEKPIQKFKEYTVKTSASISGVLHIGRLSDTIRGSSVHTALEDAGVKSRLIWVAEDMDPLRKIPEGVPSNYVDYLGMPVTDVPDPEACHESYAEHHKEQYFKVIDEFVFSDMKKFSMREEYRKGSFNEFIKKIIENIEKLVEIQDKYRKEPLPETYTPWTPICENCGKIVTAKALGFENGKVHYICKDYAFENTRAKGCGFEGLADPLKGNGKLMWKAEWAAQWAFWGVCSEGAGKEYQVPNSAWWVNGEIAEKVLEFPMPEPIFYEHLIIEGVKMSASLGNVIYPKDWLEVATPEMLRFYYNKRLMKTRSFSWKELPNLYDDFDYCNKVYFGNIKIDNKKELSHIKRLYDISVEKPQKPINMSFNHAVVLAQVFDNDTDIIDSLKKTGHHQPKLEKEILSRIYKAGLWVRKYAPEEQKFEVQKELPKDLAISEKEIKAFKRVLEILKQNKEMKEDELFKNFYDLCKELNLEPKQFFKAGYKVLLNKDQGPRLASFMLALGEKATALLEKL